MIEKYKYSKHSHAQALDLVIEFLKDIAAALAASGVSVIIKIISGSGHLIEAAISGFVLIFIIIQLRRFLKDSQT